MTAIQERIMSVEEYMQYELQAEERHEFIDGRIIEMAGEQSTTISLYSYPFIFFQY